jgi:hypothetical protein
MTTISISQGNTISFSQTGDIISYTTTDQSYTPVAITWPITIINNTPSPTQNVTVLFTTDMTISSSVTGTPNASTGYFICGSTNIQFGSQSLNLNGTRRIITISGLIEYVGLIQNGFGDTSGYSNITIYNISVNNNGSTLTFNNGWVAQSTYSINAIGNFIINCTANGNLTRAASGGIVGANAGRNGSLTIIGCSFTGEITNATANSGGIVSSFAASTNGTLLISNCFSTGPIAGSNSGGIVGIYARAGCTVTNCYSTGSISGARSGGIFGDNGSGSLAQNCYSLGNISATCGGIYGPQEAAQSAVRAINCYSNGTNNGSNGIVAPNGVNPPIITNCYASNATWSDTAARTALVSTPSTSPGIGTVWISLGLDQPYILNNFDSSPFTLNNIIGNNIVQTVSVTVTAGSSTAAAPVAGYKTFDIIGGGNSTISISNTGMISTTSVTLSGIYTLLIYAVDDYTTTTFILTVNAAELPILNNQALIIPPCCQPNVCNANPQTSNYNSDVIINKAGGKAIDKSVENFYVGVATGQRTAHSQPIFKSYYDYMNYLQGKYK